MFYSLEVSHWAQPILKMGLHKGMRTWGGGHGGPSYKLRVGMMMGGDGDGDRDGDEDGIDDDGDDDPLITMEVLSVMIVDRN